MISYSMGLLFVSIQVDWISFCLWDMTKNGVFSTGGSAAEIIIVSFVYLHKNGVYLIARYAKDISTI